jgi:hypothetical protein
MRLALKQKYMKKTTLFITGTTLALVLSLGLSGLAFAESNQGQQSDNGRPNMMRGATSSRVFNFGSSTKKMMGKWRFSTSSTSTRQFGRGMEDRFSTSTERGPGFHAVNGTVSAVGTSTLTITSNNQTVYTINSTASTTITKTPKVVILFSDIKVGDKVNVQGQVSSTTVSATRIMVITPGQGNDHEASSTKPENKQNEGFFNRIKSFFGRFFGR